MIKENLNNITEVEFEKILYAIEKMGFGREILGVSLSRTSDYSNEKNEYIVKTDKVYQDKYIKLSIKYA